MGAILAESKLLWTHDPPDEPDAVLVQWAEVVAGCGLPGLGRLGRAMLRLIGAISDQDSDADRDALRRYADETALFVPIEGAFPYLSRRSILTLLTRMGLKVVRAAHEFDATEPAGEVVTLERLEGEIDDPESEAWTCGWGLVSPDGPREGHTLRRIFDPDGPLTIVVDWDSFFFLIAGCGQQLRQAGVEDLFEGFWAGPETAHDWEWHPLPQA